ncbi:jg14284 [Pararge aegeria aegeria]|uniref:Jg14284 protein n=1 Tax=Pararge aegeria aegeria TaxID=348720 RepID=A0A8S4RS34_9NEOP|nr:jg14284 [Pararge aegeria aegeria]
MAGRMLKFIRGKGQQPSAERQKLQNELFAFRKLREPMGLGVPDARVATPHWKAQCWKILHEVANGSSDFLVESQDTSGTNPSKRNISNIGRPCGYDDLDEDMTYN